MMASKETSKPAGKSPENAGPLPTCCCPYCESEVEAKESPLCKPCGITLLRCPVCKAVVETEAVVCHRCGAAIK